jgi:hypothetical protein
MTAPPVTASPPPFRLVGEHFVAALLWLVLAAAGLVVVAPALALGNIFDPRVLAVTHAATLGVLTTMIFGSLYQFFPNALGVGARSIPVAHRTFWTLQAGVVALVVGFWWWVPVLLLAGWLLLFLAVGGLAWNLLPQRRKATQGRIVGLYVSTGHMMLGLAMALALARIGEPLGWWAVSRMGMIAAHYHLAALGFVTLTVVGVGSRMVPMFLFAQTAPSWPVRIIGPVAVVGLLVQSAGLIWTISWATVTGGLLVAVAGGLIVLQLGLWFHYRSQRKVDHATAHLVASAAFLAVTVLAGLALLFSTGRPDLRAWAAYALLGVFGWMTLFTVGIAYRIAPFLSWLHLFGGMGRGAHAPPAKALVHQPLAWAALACLGSGVMLMAVGVQLGRTAVALIGSILIAAGAAGVAAQVVRGFLIWRGTPSDPQPVREPTRPQGRQLQVLT